MTPRRFHLPRLPECRGASIVLAGAEARHLARVLRLEAGETVEFFDGTGRIARARLAAVAPDRVTAEVLDLRHEAETDGPAIVLAQALLKGKKMDLLAQKANELGAAALMPLVTRFCERREGSAAALDRWRRLALESCKQCKRATPLRVDEPLALETADFSWAALKLFAWEGETTASLPAAALGETRGPVCLLVGPEGGLSADEAALLRERGFCSFSLGGRILRAETAALAVLTLARYLTGALRPQVEHPENTNLF